MLKTIKATVEHDEEEARMIEHLKRVHGWRNKSEVFRQSLRQAYKIAPPLRISGTPDEVLRRG